MKKIIYKSILAIWSILPFKRSVVKLAQKLSIVNPKIYPDLWLEGWLKFDFENINFELYSEKKDRMTQHLFWNGFDKSWDAQSIKVWNKLSKKSDTILDIGANIGLYAIVAQKSNPKSKVIAFEPSKGMFKSAVRNFKKNDLPIIPEEIAISSNTGELEFFDDENPTAIGSLNPNSSIKLTKNQLVYKVKTVSIDNYCVINNIPQIDLISIDVEEHEIEVLNGMTLTLKTNRPIILIEVLTNKIGQEIESFFEGLNYLFYEIDEINGITSCSHLTNSINKVKGNNFLALPVEKANYLN